MRKDIFSISVPHFFSPISAFIAESNSSISISRFNVHDKLQINQYNFRFERKEV